jgi:hypothetical protein
LISPIAAMASPERRPSRQSSLAIFKVYTFISVLSVILDYFKCHSLQKAEVFILEEIKVRSKWLRQAASSFQQK